MFWSVAGANKIPALRCAVESNTFDDFCEFWAEEKKTARGTDLTHTRFPCQSNF
ncbi:MAG: hypothetical protein OXI01_13840 [Albidovulum sp.]|nr:hypothetical protein [Albidovulum sp.]